MKKIAFMFAVAAMMVTRLLKRLPLILSRLQRLTPLSLTLWLLTLWLLTQLLLSNFSTAESVTEIQADGPQVHPLCFCIYSSNAKCKVQSS